MRMSRKTLFRRVLGLGLVLALVAGFAPLPLAGAGEPSKLLVKKGDRVAIVGDSITEQKVYSRFIEDYLRLCGPDLDPWVVQLGWGGERADGFLRRMNDDLMPFKPNVVTTCYGMNDGGYRKYEEGIGRNYRQPMEAIVAALKKAGATVVVGSPGAVDTNAWRGDSTVYNDNLAHLRDIAREVAAANSTPFANVHDAMIEAMKKAKAAYGEAYHVGGGDGIHPSANGQLVMAYAFLKAMGFDGEIGTITVDLAGKATATDGHKVLSSAAGSVELESTRYPFCFAGDEAAGKSPNSTRSILPYVPFNEDLNRLRLVVKGLKAPKAKVTWGKASKTFTGDQLAAGINLAAEFLDNPFCDAFAKVDREVAAKQGYETFLIKEANRLLSGIGRYMKDDAEAQAAAKTLRARLLARHEELSAAVRSAIVPVRHTIIIQAE